MFTKLISKKYLFVALILIILSIILGVRQFKSSSPRVSAQSSLNNPGGKTVELNSEYNFPIKDGSGKEITKITYTIQNAQLQNEIVIQGQKATAITGRTFLILNLKIQNNSDSRIQMNARDYVRLSVNGTDEKLAADIHNDPVEVQPISTKYTRVGFPINKSDKDMKLQVGEIKGDKISVPLNFK